MSSFTEEEVVAEAFRRYGKSVCTDSMRDAMKEKTLNDAVMNVLLESVLWDSPTGNCMDEELWKKILPPKQ